MKKLIALLSISVFLCGCDIDKDTFAKEHDQQETLLAEAQSQIGMPAIKNFREKKMLKDILELRDQDGLTTYTYLYNEMTGKLVFFGETIGYGIPYATQFTNPLQVTTGWGEHTGHGNVAIGQADPNGLYSPASAEGTWVLLKDPNGKQVLPVYIEPRIIVSPFKLDSK